MMYYDALTRIAGLLKEQIPGVTVRIGSDKGNPFPVSESPFIVVSPGSAGMSFSATDETDEISVDLDFGILDETETDGNIKILNGIRSLDETADRIRSVLSSALDGFYIGQSSYYTDLSQYPLFVGGMTILYQNDGYTN